MATPVISASSSVLGFKRNEAFEFQPSATNMASPATPAWGAVGLPTGVSIDSTTGKISGSASVAGVYVVTVSAMNSDPATGTREFVLGIASEAAATVASADVSCEWDFDVVTRELSVLSSDDSVAAATEEEAALAYWKTDDIFLLRVRCRKNGVVVDPSPTVLKVVLKESILDGEVVLADHFVRSGATGESAYFDVLVDLSDVRLKNAISNYATKKKGLTFSGKIEVQMESEITFDSVTETLRLSSRTGLVQLSGDFVA